MPELLRFLISSFSPGIRSIGQSFPQNGTNTGGYFGWTVIPIGVNSATVTRLAMVRIVLSTGQSRWRICND
ncbi:MAG: hypothetical protein HQ518_24685 [Rhodopirellula sp.]|nr:hypothetical protein [Rhodopirellula sp.]